MLQRGVVCAGLWLVSRWAGLPEVGAFPGVVFDVAGGRVVPGIVGATLG